MNVDIYTTSTISQPQIMMLKQNFVALPPHEAIWLGCAYDSKESHYDDMCRRLTRNLGVITLATFKGRIIGSMHAIFYPQKARLHQVKLRRLIVDPQFRGQGIATGIFNSMEVELHKRDKTHIHFGYHRDNPAATLYHRLGYHTPENYNIGRKLWIKVEKTLV